MATLPTLEAIALEVRRSLGLKGYPPLISQRFAAGDKRMKEHKQMFLDVMSEIFSTLEVNGAAEVRAYREISNFANALGALDGMIWTYDADDRQVVWMILAYFIVPGLARFAAWWTLDSGWSLPLPQGPFWYLPDVNDCKNAATNDKVELPIPRIINWLMGRIALSVDQFENRLEERFEDQLDRRRLLHYWRAGKKLPDLDSLDKFSQLYASISGESVSLIRRNLLVARAAQYGYNELLTFLCPGTPSDCSKPQKNKLLQIVSLIKTVGELTINVAKEASQKDEDEQFQSSLPTDLAHGPLLSILPSSRNTNIPILAEILSRHFENTAPGAALDDVYPLAGLPSEVIRARHFHSYAIVTSEIQAAERLHADLRRGAPWQKLKTETRFRVVNRVAEMNAESRRNGQATLERLRALAVTNDEKLAAIICELRFLLAQTDRSRSCRDKVEALIGEAKANPALERWKAPILVYSAQHQLCLNEFKEAEKLLRDARAACQERGYGDLRGEIAEVAAALAVSDQRLISEHFEIFYRDMLRYGVFHAPNIPSLQESAVSSSTYFWKTLYRPYAGLAPYHFRSVAEDDVLAKNFMDYLGRQDWDGLAVWVKKLSIAKNPLHYVRGDSVLLLIIKLRTNFQHPIRGAGRGIADADLSTMHSLFGAWRTAIGIIIDKTSVKHLEIADFKGQTPLMLMAEEGDAEMVKRLLNRGVDPNLADYEGRTALHAAVKSGITECFDVLVDLPCELTRKTIDGRSALHTAAWTGNVHAAKKLVDRAPQLNRGQDHSGLTPLELAELLTETPEALEVLAADRRLAQEPELRIGDILKVIQILENAPLS